MKKGFLLISVCLVFLFVCVEHVFAVSGIERKDVNERKKSETVGSVPLRDVRGIVVDDSGQPIIGASVVVKGTTQGTVTDIDGQFVLSVRPGDVLEVSFLGYTTREITVRQKGQLNITLWEDEEVLDELVVVGYGSLKRNDLTGAVSSVSGRSLRVQPNNSANSVLSGRVPGVAVRRTNGAPGQASTIRIRGANSIYGGSDPLIVVDGNYGSMPDAYDIESIEILKDASATAIYGSRGANGVILVTTKRGKEGRPRAELHYNASFDQVPRRYDLMNAYEFASFNAEMGAYPFSQDELDYFRANPKGTDWQDQVFRTGFSQNYKAVVSGGNESVRYYVSPAYQSATGIVIGTEAKGYGVNGKIDVDLNKHISVQFETDIDHNEDLNPGMAQGGSKTDNPLMAALIWSPTEPVRESDGTYTRLGVGSGTMLNPVLLTTREQRNYGTSVMGVGNLNIKIVDGLELNAKAAMTFGMGGQRSFESKEYNGVNASASQSSYENRTWLVNAFLSYDKMFAGSHSLSLMAGFEETQTEHNNFSATAEVLPIESSKWYNLGLAAPNVGVGSGYSNSALRSFFGRVNYNYRSRYYITANFRADGSSKFRDENKFGYFPSFSLAWKLTEEDFMKGQHIFSNIKLRGGWGVTGNQAVSEYATYNVLRSHDFSWGMSSDWVGYRLGIGGNPDLKWESTKQLNLGLDIGLLDNRLMFAFDYYDKRTEDLLAPKSVPAYNGAESETIISNVGSVQNRGFEFNVDYTVVQSRNFNYVVNLNGALNRNKVLDLGEQDLLYGDTYAGGLGSTSPFVLMPGQPIGTIYGLKYLGIWQQDEAEEAALYEQKPGDYRYEDLNGDHAYSADDNQVIGHATPDFTWGFNNTFSWGDFTLNILFEGAHGRDVLNWSYMMMAERVDLSQTYTLREARDRWSPDNPQAQFGKADSNTNKLNPISSQYMQDGSYIKLRNISLSYTFKRRLTGFASIKLMASVQNVLTITPYKGYDPEISSSVGSDVSGGMDFFAYPNPRSFSIGVSIRY